MNKIDIFKGTLGSILSFVLYFLGGWDVALQTLIAFIVIDYITGICKAFYEGKLNSKIGVKGIVKKVGYLLIVAVSFLVDTIINANGIVRATVIYIFVANEGISILENWGGMGLPIPPVLIEKLEQLKKEEK
ncbi:MAG: phage holin family protein [Clostridia bacterium]|nr:phage holin family protein [Clostridia bacterium]